MYFSKKIKSMLDTDKELFRIINTKIKKNISFIEEIATALEVNYDAAYRRIKGKTKLSLNDSVKLSKYFNVSLNDLYLLGDDSKIFIRKTQEIKNFKSLEEYYRIIQQRLKPIEYNNDATMYYSAKELPVFHLLYDTQLLRFKLYVWLQILGKDNYSKKIKFEDFVIPDSLIQVSLVIGEQYRRVKIIEMWSSNIINSTLHQIQYFYEANLLSYKNAIIILNDLKKTIKSIEETAHVGERNNSNKTKYELYYNPLLNSNNNVLVSVSNYKVLYMSYSVLRYYEIEDEKVCDNMEDFFNNQIILSKQITKSGIKDILLFFKPLYRQINDLVKQINLHKQFPIQKF